LNLPIDAFDKEFQNGAHLSCQTLALEALEYGVHAIKEVVIAVM
jgi:hypothetical protein